MSFANTEGDMYTPLSLSGDDVHLPAEVLKKKAKKSKKNKKAKRQHSYLTDELIIDEIEKSRNREFQDQVGMNSIEVDDSIAQSVENDNGPQIEAPAVSNSGDGTEKFAVSRFLACNLPFCGPLNYEPNSIKANHLGELAILTRSHLKILQPRYSFFDSPDRLTYDSEDYMVPERQQLHRAPEFLARALPFETFHCDKTFFVPNQKRIVALARGFGLSELNSYIQTEFAPVGSAPCYGSLLAILLDDYTLNLRMNTQGNRHHWEIVADISELMQDELGDLLTCHNGEDTEEYLIRRLKFATLTISWSSIIKLSNTVDDEAGDNSEDDDLNDEYFDDDKFDINDDDEENNADKKGKFTILATAGFAGIVSFWRIPVPFHPGKMINKISAENCSCDIPIKKIDFLQTETNPVILDDLGDCCQIMKMAVGFENGAVEIWKLKVKKSDCCRSGIEVNRIANLEIIPPEIGFPISFLWRETQDLGVNLAVAKGLDLHVYTIDFSEDLEQIVCQQRAMTMAISGVCWLNDSDILISAFNGDVKLFHHAYDLNSLTEMPCEDLTTQQLTKIEPDTTFETATMKNDKDKECKNSGIYGLSTSQNAAFLRLVKQVRVEDSRPWFFLKVYSRMSLFEATQKIYALVCTYLFDIESKNEHKPKSVKSSGEFLNSLSDLLEVVRIQKKAFHRHNDTRLGNLPVVPQLPDKKKRQSAPPKADLTQKEYDQYQYLYQSLDEKGDNYAEPLEANEHFFDRLLEEIELKLRILSETHTTAEGVSACIKLEAYFYMLRNHRHFSYDKDSPSYALKKKLNMELKILKLELSRSLTSFTRLQKKVRSKSKNYKPLSDEEINTLLLRCECLLHPMIIPEDDLSPEIYRHFLDSAIDALTFVDKGKSRNELGYLMDLSESIDDSAKFQTLLLSKSSHFSTKQKCIVCRQDIPFSSPFSETCPNGHTWDRCFATQSIVFTPQVFGCSLCNRKYLAKPNSKSSLYLESYLRTRQGCNICGGNLTQKYPFTSN